jgi:aldehyde:ferredoxin oxidoreductase
MNARLRREEPIMFGHHGRIMNIDVTDSSFQIETYDEAFARAYLGGNGFAAKILYDRLPPGIDPFDPRNIIVFAVGPVTDTAIPSTSRGYTASKSPLNGLFFDSTFGGRFAITQKRTGFEAIVVTGKSAAPVYLYINENKAEVRPAHDIWGKNTQETAKLLRDRHGTDSDVAAIGPAGENLVRFACISHSWKGRSGISGRGGLGAVLGSKKIKALVVKGKRKTDVAHPERLKDLVARQRETLKKGTAALSEFGTPVLVQLINVMGAMGTRNLQKEFSEEAEAISGKVFKEAFFAKHTSCAQCPVACGKISSVRTGPGAGLSWKMPEYETIYALGSMVENYDVPTLIQANRLCDEMGLDTITMGVTLAFAMECYEKGFLSRKDAGDIPVTFGSPDAILGLIRETAARQGLGKLLSEGSERMAAQLDPKTTEFLYTVKKVEIPGHSARVLKGLSIGYPTGTRGGSHHDTRPTLQYTNEQDNVHPKGQPEYAMRTQNFTALGDSLTQCRFVSERGYGMTIGKTYAEMINAVTGWNLTTGDVERIGERICNLERGFNVREGVSRKDDTLPYRVMEEPVPYGAHEGMRCSREELDRMLDGYYRLRGWTDQGIPTGEKLHELQLDFVAENLWKKDRGN